MIYRDSVVPTSTSSNSYPSTLSGLSHSALGLTDSPLPAPDRMTANSEISSTDSPPRPLRNVHQSQSKSSLRQEVTKYTAASRLAKGSSQMLLQPQQKVSQSNLRPIMNNNNSPSRHEALDKSATPTIASARVSKPPVEDLLQSKTAQAAATIPTRKPKPSPSETETTLAEEWETELVKNARNLTIHRVPSHHNLTIEKEEQRQKELDWEQFGAWEDHRDAAREAEDRVRRDAGRKIGESALVKRR
ncbi:hypothetical protein IAR55_004564 [Kwoniella newhampshirensis]|uniref:Uncharacterized protein n=1 Tax=Kwoniella newhampshirensis TaxID=1651941 RepID=A0AAW0YXD7_9TREE